MPRRMRTNIVVDGMAAYDEEHLFTKSFKLGDLIVNDSLPVKRCIVPARDPETGQPDKKFIGQVLRERIESYKDPELAKIGFKGGQSYRASINTKIVGEQSGVVKLGDELRIISNNLSAGQQL